MRALLAVLLAASVLLAACAQPAMPVPSPTATLPPTLTPIPPAATPAGPSPTPAPTATQPSLFAPVTDADWQIGPQAAVVTLVAYDDFQCAFGPRLEIILR